MEGELIGIKAVEDLCNPVLRFDVLKLVRHKIKPGEVKDHIIIGIKAVIIDISRVKELEVQGKYLRVLVAQRDDILVGLFPTPAEGSFNKAGRSTENVFVRRETCIETLTPELIIGWGYHVVFAQSGITLLRLFSLKHAEGDDVANETSQTLATTGRNLRSDIPGVLVLLGSIGGLVSLGSIGGVR